jgi:hypothetical protein
VAVKVARRPAVSCPEFKSEGELKRAFELNELCGDGAIAFKPENRAGKAREPRLVKGSTPHLDPSCVVTAGPIQELNMTVVERATGHDSVVAVARGFSRSQSAQPNLCRHDE